MKLLFSVIAKEKKKLFFSPPLMIPSEFTHLLFSCVPFFTKSILPNLQSYMHTTHMHAHTPLFVRLKTPIVSARYRAGWIFHFHFIWPSCWLRVDNSSFVWARSLWIWISGSLLAHLRNALREISKRNEICSYRNWATVCVCMCVKTQWTSTPSSKLHHCRFRELPLCSWLICF